MTKSYDQAVWTAIDSVTTDTTSSARQFYEYDRAELRVVSEVATAWTGTVQVQGSQDGTNFSNLGSAITTAGFYFIDPIPEWLKLVTTRTAGTLQCEVRGVVVK